LFGVRRRMTVTMKSTAVSAPVSIAITERRRRRLRPEFCVSGWIRQSNETCARLGSLERRLDLPQAPDQCPGEKDIRDGRADVPHARQCTSVQVLLILRRDFSLPHERVPLSSIEEGREADENNGSEHRANELE
jgi:hypothetical protein